MKSALFSLFLCLATALAQTPLGTVTGLASDASGASVPGVSITLTNQQTGVKRSTVSNESGVYSFPNLQPGAYKLSAEAKGFRTLETEVFPVDAFRTVRQDLKFQVASGSTEVTVTDTVSPAIQIESPAITAALGTKQLIELPTNLRSVAKNSGDSGLISEILPETIPGVVQVGAGAKWLTPGAGAASVKTKVDGIETTFGNFGSPDNVSQPSMEAIQEFTANVLTSRAEFGGMGTITTVTKSGTNQYHGDLFWYARNAALDARNTFSPTKPFQNMQNYGVSGGGPIQKNKTFVFADFDGQRGVAFYSFTPNVPTEAMRSGNFAGSAALTNPFSNINPFGPNNTILPQYLSPQALKIQQQFFPQPNFGPANSTSANYRASFNGPEVHRLFEIKLDHNFSERHSAFLRYQVKKDDYRIPGARSTLPPSSVGTSTNIRRVNFWTFGDVYSIRPNLFNEFRAGVVILVSASDADIKGQPLIDQFGITGLPPRVGVKGVPNINITGFNVATQSLLNPVNDGHAQFADNLTWVRGRHAMKFGVEEVQWFDNRWLTTNAGLFGNITFTGRFTGSPYADFLLGLPNTVTRLDPYPTQYNRWSDWNFYAQDDFKVTPRLTLSYGLRYEFNQPVHTTGDNLYSFDLASGAIIVPSQASFKAFSPFFPANLPIKTADQVGLGNSLRHADSNNFAPRFGFSYQIGSDAKTVLRGGWGVYYSHFSANVAAGLASGPFAISTVSTNAFTNGQPQFTLAAPFQSPNSPGTLSLTAVSPRLLNSYAQQYSLSLERELSHDIGVRVSYIGTKGTQLVYERNVNQPAASTTAFAQARRPYPLYSNITYADNGANSLYSALQAQVQKRFTHGLLFSSAWTWAKEISDVDDTGDFELNTVIENTYDRRRDRGNVYSVPRHQWLNQFLYELPLGKGKLLGGWQLNGMLNVSSGNWFSPMWPGIDPSNTNTVGVRPNVVKSEISMPKSVNQWFDPSAFAAPAAGGFGNAGRGIIEGPGYVLLNAGLQKSVSLERLGKVTFSASFQNALNHVNLGEPLSSSQGFLTVTTANAGKITTTHVFPPAGSARSGMLGLRWSF
jgi:hypothetical protein